MSNPTRYRGNQGDNTVNEGKGPSPFIWADCPWSDIVNGHRPGIAWQKYFGAEGPIIAAGAQAQYGSMKGFADTGGSAVDAAAANELGGLIFSSDGDNEGASMAWAGTPLKLSRASGKLWFEFGFRTSTIADTKHGFFVGLVDALTLSATVPIAAAGTLADQNLVGFHRLEGDGDQLDCVYKANGVTQVTTQTDALANYQSGTAYQALQSDTDLKVGMLYDPADDYYVRFIYMGQVIASKQLPLDSAAGTDFPNDIGLGFVFAVLNATASTPGNTTARWARVAQLFA